LDKELLIVGMSIFIEIWDPKLYEEEMNRFAIENTEIINDVANQIFGDGEIYEHLS
jgi:DNA-binding transcriptional regulator/RsmH inhibitor MraZ